MTRDVLLAQAIALPREARTELVCSLIDSLDPPPSGDDETAWVAEVNRRLDLYRKGQLKAVPMEQAISELRAEFAD